MTVLMKTVKFKSSLPFVFLNTHNLCESLTFLFIAGFKMVDILEETDTTGKVTIDLIRGQKEVGVIATSSTDKDNRTPPTMDNMATTPTTQGLVTIPTDDTCGLKAQ